MFSSRKVGILVWLVAIGMALAGCETFSVREAEEPTGSATVFEVPRNPTTVISNLINVVRNLDAINYEELFSDDFIFIPDSKDVQEFDSYYPGVLTQWGADVEVEVGNRLLDPGRVELIWLVFTGEPNVIEDSDTSYVVKNDYEITVVGEEWEMYHGTSIFSIHLEPDGLWYINKWEDFRPEEKPEGSSGTWGILKGLTRASM